LTDSPSAANTPLLNLGIGWVGLASVLEGGIRKHSPPGEAEKG